MSEIPTIGWIVLASEALSAILVWRAWPISQVRIFRVVLIMIAAIPVLGPVAFAWIGHFPPAQHPAYRDQNRVVSDVFDRWRHVLEERDPKKRMAKYEAWVVPDRNMRRQLEKKMKKRKQG